MKILIDTNIFIDLLRKESEILKKFTALSTDAEFFYNPIIEAEILQGCKQANFSKVVHILSFCTCAAIDCQTGKIAGKYANQFLKSHHTITLDDYLIAATAKQYELVLWTKNKKHFPMKDIEIL